MKSNIAMMKTRYKLSRNVAIFYANFVSRTAAESIP